MDSLPNLKLDPLKDADMCFGCGKANPVSLKLKFTWDEANQTAAASFTPSKYWQGWSGYVHGGVTACILDESIGQATMYAGLNSVTAKLQVRYRKMIAIEQTYTVSCKIARQTSRLVETEARITDKDGNVMAEGTSTQYIVGPRLEGQILE
jgi:uncharacterized protein (TIGR00369 family)